MTKSFRNAWIGLSLLLALLYCALTFVGIYYSRLARDLRKDDYEALTKLEPFIDRISNELTAFENRPKDDPTLKSDVEEFLKRNSEMRQQSHKLSERLSVASAYEEFADKVWIAAFITLLLHLAVNIKVIRDSRRL